MEPIKREGILWWFARRDFCTYSTVVPEITFILISMMRLFGTPKSRMKPDILIFFNTNPLWMPGKYTCFDCWYVQSVGLRTYKQRKRHSTRRFTHASLAVWRLGCAASALSLSSLLSCGWSVVRNVVEYTRTYVQYLYYNQCMYVQSVLTV